MGRRTKKISPLLVSAFLFILAGFSSCRSTPVDDIFDGAFLTDVAIKNILVIDQNTIQIIYNQQMAPAPLGQAANYHIELEPADSDSEPQTNGETGLTIQSVEAIDGTNHRAVEIITERQTGAFYRISIKGQKSRYGRQPAAGTLVSTFRGYNFIQDEAVDILLPETSGYVYGPEVSIVWTPSVLQAALTVSITTDEEGTEHISGSPFYTGNDTNFLTINKILLPEAVTYFIQIYSEIQGDLVASSRFDYVRDAIFVYCPDGSGDADCDGFKDDSGSAFIQAGNRSNPFHNIQQAVDTATLIGINEVRVAARNSTEPFAAYSGSIRLNDAIQLKGGYRPVDFKARSRETYRTPIVGTGITTVQIGDLPNPTLIDGFELYGPNSINSSVIKMVNTTDSVTVQNCILYSGSSPGTNYGVQSIFVQTGFNTGPNFESITVLNGPSDQVSYGLYFENVAPTVNNSTITAGNTNSGYSYALYSKESSPNITGSNLTSANGNYSYSVYLEGGIISLRESTIQSIGNSNNKAGVFYEPGSIIEDNIIISQAADGSSFGLYGNGDIAPLPASTIRNNIVFAGQAVEQDHSAIVDGNTFISNAYENNTESKGARMNGGITVFANNRAFFYGNPSSGINVVSTDSIALLGNRIVNGTAATPSADENTGLKIDTGADTSSHLFGNSINSHTADLSHVISITDSGLGPRLHANLLFSLGAGSSLGIDERFSTANVEELTNNFIFNTSGGFYREYTTGATTSSCPPTSIYQCYFDANPATNSIEWWNGITNPSTPQGGAGAGSGNITLASGETIGDVFVSLSIGRDIVADGMDANTNLDTGNDYFEVPDCRGGQYINGQYVEIGGDGMARQITSTDCSDTNSTISFLPALASTVQPFTEIKLWGTDNNGTGYLADGYLKSGSPGLNDTNVCSNLSAQTLIWATATDQSECDGIVPGSTYQSGRCVTYFLGNTYELTGDGAGNDNGLCESNESCVIYLNRGAYHGHGGLVSAQTPAPATPTCADIGAGGLVEHVTLFKYNQNGFTP